MNLLKRTRRLLQGLTPPPPAKAQFYNVACPEGHRLRGERTEGYQALRCPSCGEGMFILPRSPLPDPVAPGPGRGPRTPVAAEVSTGNDVPFALTDPVYYEQVDGPEADAEIEWLDPAPDEAIAAGPAPMRSEASAVPFEEEVPVEPPTTTSPIERAGAPPRPSGRPKAKSPGPHPRSAARLRPSAAEAVEVRPGAERLAAWARRRRNPLVFSAVALIVIGTVGYRAWRSRVEDLPRVVELGREQGLPALDAGHFDTAHQLLSEADRAVESLGGAVEGADEIRQGAREAAIFSNLVSDSLESILAEASPDPKEWSARFDLYYRRRSIIIDAQVSAVPDASGAGALDLDYRILTAGEGSKPRRIGRLDLRGFRLFETPPRQVGDRVVFGARLASFALNRDPSAPNAEEWLVGLEPDSGVLITHTRALESIGWPAVDAPPAEERP